MSDNIISAVSVLFFYDILRGQKCTVWSPYVVSFMRSTRTHTSTSVDEPNIYHFLKITKIIIFYFFIIYMTCILSVTYSDPQCCGSGIPDPDFYPSRIPDPGSRFQKQQQKRGVKNFCCHIFFAATNFTKLKIIIFELLKNKIWAYFQWITEKLSPSSSQKYGFGIRDPWKAYPGSQTRGQKGTGSRIRIRNTADPVVRLFSFSWA